MVAVALASISTLESVTWAFATGNGMSTADAAANMFETSVDDTVVYWEVISAIVPATIVTWWSALIASVIWMLPKYMVSISGSRSANSTAEEPPRSAAKRKLRNEPEK